MNPVPTSSRPTITCSWTTRASDDSRPAEWDTPKIRSSRCYQSVRGLTTDLDVPPITAQCHAWGTSGGLVLHNGAHRFVWLACVLPSVGRAGPAGVA